MAMPAMVEDTAKAATKEQVTIIDDERGIHEHGSLEHPIVGNKWQSLRIVDAPVGYRPDMPLGPSASSSQRWGRIAL